MIRNKHIRCILFGILLALPLLPGWGQEPCDDIRFESYIRVLVGEEIGIPMVTGTSGDEYTISHSPFPDGLSMTPDGKLYGIPVNSGSYPINVEVSHDEGCSENAICTILICEKIVMPEITGDANAGQQYTQNIQSEDLQYHLISGVLPEGLFLSDGIISGIPTKAGAFQFTIEAASENLPECTQTKDYIINVACTDINLGNLGTQDVIAGHSYDEHIPVIGGVAPFIYEITDGTLPSGLILNDNKIEGIPESYGTYDFMVTVTDVFNCSGYHNYTIKVACPELTLQPDALPDGTVEIPYVTTLAVSGGSDTYLYHISGLLPSGLKLEEDKISGVPEKKEQQNFQITTRDMKSLCEAAKDYTITITTDCSTISLGELSSVTAQIGVPYTSAALSASGGQGTYEFTKEGEWPSGWSVNSAGVISGTPFSTDPVSLTVRATDANDCFETKDYTITAGCSTISLGELSSVTAQIGVSYTSAALSASGGQGAYEFTKEGEWPSGWSVSTAGVISGTPFSTDPVSLTVRATDTNECFGTKDYTITAGCSTIVLSELSSITAQVGIPYTSAALSASGGQGAYEFTKEGEWPSGWSIGSAGIISGTPSSTASVILTVRATDANDCFGTKSYTITAGCSTISLGELSSVTAQVGVPYTSAALSASGGQGAYGFSKEGEWPAGWSVSSAGVISGTPSSTSPISLTVRVMDANNCFGTKSYTITAGCGTITLGELSPVTAQIGVPYTSAALSASGGQGAYTFTKEGEWPSGWSLSAAGVISGTPSSTVPVNLSVRTTDTNNCFGTKNYTITAGCGTIVLGELSSVTAQIGVPYSSAALSASGGQGAYTFTKEGEWPSGWSLSATGVISGTPSSTAPVRLIVRAMDTNNCFGTKSYTITAGCGTIVLGELSSVTAQIGVLYTSAALSASGGQGPYEFTKEGEWPSGWSVSAAGVISGAPSSTDPVQLIVRVTDANNCFGTKNYTITVSCGVITLGALSSTTAQVGVPYTSAALSVSGGQGAYTFAKEGEWPSGWSVSSAGVISGTPSSAVPVSLLVRATDTNGCWGTRLYIVSASCDAITVNDLDIKGKIGIPFVSDGFNPSGGSGNYTYTKDGTWPLWVWLDGNKITGTPIITGETTISVKISDSNNPACNVLKPIVIIVDCGDINFPATTLQDGAFNMPYSVAINPATGSNNTFIYSLNGTLPAGLQFDPVSRIISGTPSVSVTNHAFKIIAKDASNLQCTAEQSYTITINCANITLNDLSVANASLGDIFSATISASGGKAPYIFTKIGDEPAWLTVSGNDLKGIPLETTGQVTVQLKAEDANHCFSNLRSYTIDVGCGTVIFPATTLVNGSVNKQYNSKIGAATRAGGSFEFAYQVDPETQLPAGLTFDPVTLTISGLPTEKGLKTFRIIATDVRNTQCTQSQTYNINIGCGEIALGAINTAANFGIFFSEVITAQGGANPYTYTLKSGTLPQGLVLNTTGLLSGTPTGTSSVFTVIATDSQGCTGENTYTITVACKGGVLSPESLVAVRYGSDYTQQFSVTPGTSKDKYTLTGTIPGLTLSETGKLTGKPSQTGVFSISVNVVDANQCITSKTYVMTVNRAEVIVEPDANQNRKYKEPNKPLTYKLSGVQFIADEPGLKQAITLTTTATLDSPVGDYPITLPPTTHSNYNIRLMENANKLTIVKADQVIDFPALKSRIYGDENFNLNAGSTSGKDIMYTSNNPDIVSVSGNTVTIHNAGEAIIEARQAGDENYNAAAIKSQRLTIEKSILTVTAGNANREYGASNPTFTYTCTGWKNGDDISKLNPKPAITTTAGLTTGVGTSDIGFLATEDDHNYKYSFVKGTLSINKAPLEVKANDYTRSLNAPNPVFTYTCLGLRNGEMAENVLSPQPVLTCSATAGSGVGEYPIAVTGGVSKNYVITKYTEGTLTITGKQIVTVTVGNASKIYGDENPGFSVSYSNFQEDDDENSLDVKPVLSTTVSKTTNVGTYTIEVSGGVDSKYAFKYIPGKLTINKAPLVATIDNQQIVFNQAIPELTFTYDGWKNDDNESVLTKPIASCIAVKGSDAGTYDILLKECGTAANYQLRCMSTSGKLTISKAEQTISFAAVSPVNYIAGGTIDLIATTTAGSGIKFTSSNESVAIISEAKLIMKGSGDVEITAQHAGNKNYNAAEDVKQTVTIKKAAQEVNFIKVIPGDKKYGDPDFTISAVATSGLPVTFTSTNTDVATIKDNIVTILHAGETAIIARQEGDANYEPEEISATLSIAQATQVVIYNTLGNKKYGDAPMKLSDIATVNSGLPLTFISSDTQIAVVEDEYLRFVGAGNAVISVQQLSGNNDYSPMTESIPLPLIVDKGRQTIDIPSPQVSKTYGNVATWLGSLATVNSELPLTFEVNSTNVVKIDGDYLQITGTGTANIVVKQLGSVNYEPTNASITLSVGKAPLTIKADNKVWQEGKEFPTLTYTCSGLVYGETESVLTQQPGLTANCESHDKCPIKFIRNAEALNYTITHLPGTLTITNKAIIRISAKSVSREYGETNPAFTLIYEGFEAGDSEKDIDKLPVASCIADAASPAGTYPIEILGGADTKYFLDVTSNKGTLTVTKVKLKAKADNKMRLYGQVNPQFTATYSGFRNDENISVIDTKPHMVTSATSTSPIGGYLISIAGGSDDCYDFEYTDGWLTVLSTSVELTLGNLDDKIYGDAPFVLPITSEGVSLADLKVNITPVDNPAVRAVYNGTQWVATIFSAGSVNIRIIFEGDEYRSGASASGNLTVHKAVLVAKADDKERKSDALDPEWTISYSGFIGMEGIGDIDQLPVASCDVQSNSMVGNYPIIVSGGADHNYEFSYQQGTLQITSAEKMPTAFTPNGDGVNDIFANGYKVKIFNRLGVMLYDGNTNNGWDGAYKGRVVAPGVYFYITTSPQGAVSKGTVEVIKTR